MPRAICHTCHVPRATGHVPHYPALEIRFAPGPGAGGLQDLLYAELDAFEPTAIEDHETCWRVFFTSSAHRDEAGAALRSAFGGHVLDLARLDVDDEDWARRSQADLKAITVGNIVVAPPWDLRVPGSGVRDPGSGPPSRLRRYGETNFAWELREVWLRTGNWRPGTEAYFFIGAK